MKAFKNDPAAARKELDKHIHERLNISVASQHQPHDLIEL